ncbi:Lrp/AsnC family transcriptional regulator [Rhodobacter maris]|uniref:AsnC family transcriptional regulator n=1 Tax=Rhodobacter maris TaxID=446682 RepID=A0A285SN79_9RHOB|nr:Lrp/AsnC family transcriptional regulator [Rhodobacter maris]SOC09425.1 AsnC family transcriptional regulator [Rhodobacter maris]
MPELDLIDRKIIVQLMEDATLPVALIADRVGLSQTPCWKRIRRLEQNGVIPRRVALADPAALGIQVEAFVLIEVSEQGAEAQAALCALRAETPEVMEIWRIAGEHDYLLRIAAPDIASFDAICHRLQTRVPLRRLNAHLALERIAFTTAYPLDTHP